MKRLIVFILILASSLLSVLACGPYYPEGDDVRFSILNPSNFGYADFHIFNYSSTLFQPGNTVDTAMDISDNVNLWKTYCKNKVDFTSIEDAVYNLPSEDFNTVHNKNLMILYLQKIKDTTAINYLTFAKNCEKLNQLYDDPWERTATFYYPQHTLKIQQAYNEALTTKNRNIQLRYAFLTMRLAYYRGESNMIEKVYKEFFSGRKNKNIIDYWALYFWAQTKPVSAEKNYYAAQVFSNAPDKRFVILNEMYSKSVPLTATLHFAKNEKDIAAILLIEGIKNPGKNLPIIKNIYKQQPDARGLSFLLLREINKLEDWIYTPYYTYFPPSLAVTDWQAKDFSKKSQERVDSDKIYAVELLQFIQSVNINKTADPILWNTAKAYLYCMINNYGKSIAAINTIEHSIKKNNPVYTQLQIIKAICITARQPFGNTNIAVEIKPLLIGQYQQKNYRFIFAIARELEYKGNTTDAGLLFSKINNDTEQEYDDNADKNKVFWRTRKNYCTLLLDFYEDYFFYLDAQYTTDQLQTLITAVRNNKSADTFSQWEYSNAKKDLSRLNDLLGTKYIRKNDLQNALVAFNNVDDTLWKSANYSYQFYLTANPFYTNLYNEHNILKQDSTHYNKRTITKTLVDYLNKAANANNTNRDYYYFLVANCYLNMTQYGNSWMMRRYYWSNDYTKTKLIDDNEYFNCDLAKEYYSKARQATKSGKFAALCLRMEGRCEKYKMISTGYFKNKDISDSALFRSNKYYAQLKKDYPQDYDELISNCQSFNSYFSTRDIFHK